MSNQSHPPARSSVTPATAAEHAPGHEHDDDLIVTPKGSSRVRFLLTLFLVLFVLVTFVVADLFQFVVGGAGRSAQNPTVLTWRDPVRGEDEAVDAMEFDLTTRLLSQMAALGFYQADSFVFGDPTDRRRRMDPEDTDVASFLVYEDLAEDAGIGMSDQELRDLLIAMFQTGDTVQLVARQYQMSTLQLQEGIRRVRRVEKLKELLRSGTRLADPEAMVAKWQGDHTQFNFEYAEVPAANFTAEAQAVVPTNEELLTWWRARPQSEQQQLFSEEKVAVQVAWLDLAGSFDPATLLEAFPRPDGADLDVLARNYYDRYRALRFLNPNPPAPEEGGGEAQDADEKAEQGKYLEFDAVKDQALNEAKIEASLVDLITDLNDRGQGGEAIDLGVESGKYGMESYTTPDPLSRLELGTAEGWGNQNLAQRLAFGEKGKLLANVVVEGTRMYLGRVVDRTARAEQPIEVIREQVLKKWTTNKALDLALERANALIATMAEKPAEHPADLPWTPVVDSATFHAKLTEASLTVFERGWRERFEVPGNDFNALTEGERFLMNEASDYYELPEGAVGAPKRSATPSVEKVFIARFVGKRAKPTEELKAKDLAALPGSVRFEAMQDLGKQIFLGDSAWFTQRFQVRFPEKERRAAQAPAQGT